MRWFLVWCFLLPVLASGATTAADLGHDLREISLDPSECYRVRDLALYDDEAHIFFTDGYLIFSKPVAGVRTSAVFTADVEGGDAEVLVLPPNRGERRSLATYTGSPNLDEHFIASVLIFSDDTYTKLTAQIAANPSNRKVREMGAVLADRWNSVVRNLTSSFQTRLVFDLLSGAPVQRGFLAASISGNKLGNFDLYYDRSLLEQMVIGKINTRDNQTFFDVWTSFVTRSHRNQPVQPDLALDDYRIEATLKPDLDLEVVTHVKVKALRTAMPVLSFDIAQAMQVQSALVDGQPAEVFRRESLRSELLRNAGNETFVVVPPAPLVPGREYQLEFHHEGKVIADAGNKVYFVGARANWYPNSGLQFAHYDLTFRYPKDLDLVTAGEIVDSRVDGDWRITHRRTVEPIRIAGFNLGRYRMTRASRAGFTVEVYENKNIEPALALHTNPSQPLSIRLGEPEAMDLPTDGPPDSASRLEQLAADVAAVMEFLAARFGPPATRHLTVSPVPGRFGQGFPGLIYLSTMSYLNPEERAMRTLEPRARLFFTDLLYAHETAHQWWGNIVTSAGYHDEWLMEALADYSALLYLENKVGAQPVASVLDVYKTNLLAKTPAGPTVESAGPIVLGMRLDSSQTPDAYRVITYGKGSWIMHMLRRLMGDERFLALLAELRKQYERKPISTEDFRLLAARFLPPHSPDPDLETFFDQWVYGTGIPTLKLTYKIRGKAPALHLEGEVTQSDVDPNFSVSVPVEIQLGHGKRLIHLVSTNDGVASFSVPLQQMPSKVLLDPDFDVLRK